MLHKPCGTIDAAAGNAKGFADLVAGIAFADRFRTIDRKRFCTIALAVPARGLLPLLRHLVILLPRPVGAHAGLGDAEDFAYLIAGLAFKVRTIVRTFFTSAL